MSEKQNMFEVEVFEFFRKSFVEFNEFCELNLECGIYEVNWNLLKVTLLWWGLVRFGHLIMIEWPIQISIDLIDTSG